METASLKSFATWARRELITQVNARLTAVLAPASMERVENAPSVARLEQDIAHAGGGTQGRAAIVDKVAYTWFNRVVALRFMDANGYTGVGVVSPAYGHTSGQPEVLADAKRGNIDTGVVRSQLVLEKITGLLNGTRNSADPQGEAYALLLAEYCRHWHRFMPFMFEREGDYTELLIPANLLASDSILSKAVETLTIEACRDVEVIGWLYQFYISERKDEVFAGFKKGKKAGAAEIPPATQLFTPDWIVRYLVENSVGRLWVLNHPDSEIVEQMDYYIAPVDEETDFLRISGPEELTVIDPACGSGHMLTYAFDLLYAIYEEEGYAPSEIPELILTHNLFGTEIDARAGALAAFALTMKARAKQRTFFSKQLQPSICVLEPVSFAQGELEYLFTDDGDNAAEELFWNQFSQADTFGSLIRPNRVMTSVLETHLASFDDANHMLHDYVLERACRVIDQAKYLGREYAVAVANPPYMGSGQMGSLLSRFMKEEYPTAKADLMTGFMVRSRELTQTNGIWAMINLPSWMALKSFEELRRDLLRAQRIVSMVHLGRGIFGSDFGSVAFVMANSAANDKPGIYRRLFEQHVEVRSVQTIEALFLDATYKRYEVSQSDFSHIPGTPIVYWLSEKMRAAFMIGRSLGEVADLLVGLRTGDNASFIRLWWEVAADRTFFDCESLVDAASSKKRWFPYNKGGSFRKWYGNQEYVVNWEDDGREIEEGLARRYPYMVPKGKTLLRGQGRHRYFSPSVSWSDISSGEAAFRRYPAGFIYANSGHSAFGDDTLLDHIILLMNSTFAARALQVLAPTLHFDIGYVGLLPVASDVEDVPIEIFDNLVKASRDDWNIAERSWGFRCNPLVSIARGRGE